MLFAKPEPVTRITTVGISPQAEQNTRIKRYLISMSIRTGCFVAAVAVDPGPLRWVLLLAAIFLPYLAVVFANNTAPPAQLSLPDIPKKQLVKEEVDD